MSRLAATALGAWALVSGAAGLQLASNSSVESRGRNVCMMGRFAPELFLLGVPKGGSTSFYEDFVRSKGVVRFVPEEAQESWQVKEPWVFAPHLRSVKGKEYWLSHYKACGQRKREVALDATPGYFGCPHSPRNIYSHYAGGGHPARLKFMVFLRDPATRTHSHYYHYVENGVHHGAFNDVGCPAHVFPKTFAHAVQSILADGKVCHNCLCNDVISHSMYPSAFRNWFGLFSPAQFFVLPFRMAVEHSAVEFTWDLLGIPHGHGAKKALASEDGGGVRNHHKYPPLKRDLSRRLNRKFRWHMEKKAGAHAVAKVLAHTSAYLYKFEGSMRDSSAISHWLSGNWGA